MFSSVYWTLASWRRALLRRWHTADKTAWAAVGLILAVLAGLGAGMQVHVEREEERREAARAIELENLACLARNVYFESRGEPPAGMRAVAEVTMNRVASRLYPGSVCAVVYQKNWDPIRKRYVGAFSWTEFDSLPEPEGEAWRRAQEFAEAAFYRRAPVTLPGVLHFHATHIRPEWSKEKTQVARIGRHLFYR
jgi:spore germination cell wall hydrolase CwlJ-like protein